MTKALEMGYRTPESLYHIGMVYLKRGKTELARQALESAVDGSPEFYGIEEARAALSSL